MGAFTRGSFRGSAIMRGGVWSGRIRRAEIYTIPFTDNAGRPALTVFESDVFVRLPPLYSFAMYFTHPDATPDNVNAEELLRTTDASSSYKHEGFPLRLDLYFVAGGDVEACMAHYRKEKEVRGLYTVQMEECERRMEAEEYDPDKTDQPPAGFGVPSDTYSKVPGLVPSYQYSGPCRRYHSVIWVCPSKNWQEDRLRRITQRVIFDPLSPEEYAKKKSEGEPDELEPVLLWPERMADEAEGSMDTEPVGGTMFNISNQQTDAGPWQRACDRGWKSW